MKTLIGTLILVATLANAPVKAAADDPASSSTQATQQVQPAGPPPADPPPPPPAVRPKPPSEPPQAPPQQKPSDTGQWVYTEQYGWVWMPYGDTYTHVPPDGATPSMYVYYPEAGWCWVVAPWLWGWGPMPFFGMLGPRYYGWFGVGLGRWHGFAGPYAHWGWHGRAYWGGGRWNGVNRSYGHLGRGGVFRGGGGFSRGLGRGGRR